MNPNDIVLEDLSKSFEYVKACNEIDSIEDIEDLRNISKAYMKLYLKQQEIVKNLALTGL
jgi:hypothetical protein